MAKSMASDEVLFLRAAGVEHGTVVRKRRSIGAATGRGTWIRIELRGYNYVMVLGRQYGLTRDEALTRTFEDVACWADEFLRLEELLPEQRIARGLNDEETCTALQLVKCMHDSLGGYPEWNRDSKRYTNPVPASEAAHTTWLLPSRTEGQ